MFSLFVGIILLIFIAFTFYYIVGRLGLFGVMGMAARKYMEIFKEDNNKTKHKEIR